MLNRTGFSRHTPPMMILPRDGEQCSGEHRQRDKRASGAADETSFVRFRPVLSGFVRHSFTS
jgi:hypothetical protein